MADDFNDNPGPGAYRIQDQQPVYTIAARLRAAGEDAAGQPGPGTYSRKPPGKGPSYSLPARLNPLMWKDCIPGPGTYSFHTHYTQSRPPSSSIASRLEDSRTGKNAGSGLYDPKLRNCALSFSLRMRTTEGARNKDAGFDDSVYTSY